MWIKETVPLSWSKERGLRAWHVLPVCVCVHVFVHSTHRSGKQKLKLDTLGMQTQTCTVRGSPQNTPLVKRFLFFFTYMWHLKIKLNLHFFLLFLPFLPPLYHYTVTLTPTGKSWSEIMSVNGASWWKDSYYSWTKNKEGRIAPFVLPLKKAVELRPFTFIWFYFVRSRCVGTAHVRGEASVFFL